MYLNLYGICFSTPGILHKKNDTPGEWRVEDPDSYRDTPHGVKSLKTLTWLWLIGICLKMGIFLKTL
jgi:hypothetical protein